MASFLGLSSGEEVEPRDDRRSDAPQTTAGEWRAAPCAQCGTTHWDFGAQTFPGSTMEDLGAQFVTFKDGGLVTVDASVLKGKKIGLYFSAHWCPPCRGFTPVLAKIYEEVCKKHDGDFEVIFVSRDQDEPSFKDYLGDMPWLAIPFNDSQTRNKLCSKYSVNGIPKLVILGPDGEVVAKSAVGTLRKAGVDGAVAQYPWQGAGENESEG